MKIWAYVMLAVTTIGGFLTFMFTMKKAGRDAAEADQMEETLEKGRKHRARKSNIGRLSNDRLAKRLRRWERK